MKTVAALAKYEAQAIDFVERNRSDGEFTTVMLDDWSGIRLIYETKSVINCSNYCESCSTYQLLAEEQKIDGSFLRTTLVRSSIDHTDIAANRMLNCKTRENYMKSFSEWLIRRCKTESDFLEELHLIKNFRVIFSLGSSSQIQLYNVKRSMVEEILRNARIGIQGPRKEILERAIMKTFDEMKHCLQPILFGRHRACIRNFRAAQNAR